MADPFEVRIRFTSLLQHLDASVTSAQKAASYALKNRDMDEDLHSCILEQLERNNMNVRANILFFIEHLCDFSQREDHLDFVQMIQKDILRIIDAVAPSDGSGAANVKLARKVVSGLERRRLLGDDTVQEIDKRLSERDTATAPVINGQNGKSGAAGGKTNGIARLDKKQIERRMEEDRERHKRLRESIWATSTADGDEATREWEEAVEEDEDDLIEAKEQKLQQAQSNMFA